MILESVDPKREFEKMLEQFKEHLKSTDLSHLSRDPMGGRLFPSGRFQSNTSFTDEVKKAAVAMGCDVTKCNMKFWSNVSTKEIIGKMVEPKTPGSMVINLTREGFATLNMQNVMEEAPDLRPVRKQWVPATVQSFGAETYFVFHLGAAKLRSKRRVNKSEGEAQNKAENKAGNKAGNKAETKPETKPETNTDGTGDKQAASA